MLRAVLVILASYLIGSVPTGFILGSLSGVDIRSEGSGNIGATNVARTLGWVAGVATLLVDTAKGLIPVIFALWLGFGPDLVATAGLAAFLGHVFSVFLRFRGGKGVATALGILVGVTPLVAPVLVASFLVVAGLTRRVSMGSLAAAAVCPVAVWGLSYAQPYIWLSLILGVLVILRHHDNIRRMLAGKEEEMRVR